MNVLSLLLFLLLNILRHGHMLWFMLAINSPLAHVDLRLLTILLPQHTKGCDY